MTRAVALVAGAALCLSGGFATAEASAATGDLTQKPGTAGCITESGSGGACVDGTALEGAYSVTVSPDGKNAYVASTVHDAVAVFDRAADGTLTQKPGTAGCISNSGLGGACANGTGLGGARSVTVSPDGLSVYVAAGETGSGVAIFDRAADGTLTQKPGTAGCISETGTSGTCTDGKAVNGATSVTVSPDGRNAYVSSTVSDAVAVFDRTADGALTQKLGTSGCVSETGTFGTCANGEALGGALSVTVSPDGASAYVASEGSNAVAVFDRGADGTLTQKLGVAGCISEDGTGGACVDGTALVDAESVTVSPDGRSVYVAAYNSDGAVVVFDRAANGALTQKPGTAGCISEEGTGGACVDGRALEDAASVTVSLDGQSVYVAAQFSDAVAVFDRADDGTLTQKSGDLGCISETGAGPCADGKALDDATAVTVSPDGKSVYVASSATDSLAVLDREPADFTLVQKTGTAGCVSETGTGGDCVDGNGLLDAYSVTVSPDGRSLYAATYTGDGGVVVFDRSADGGLTQKPGAAGCISDTAAPPCADGTALGFAASVTVSPDGENAYVASQGGDAVAVFDRAADGSLTQKAGAAGCISDSGFGPCTDGAALNGAYSVTVSPDGESVYVASNFGSDAIAIFDRAPDGTLTQKAGTAGCISDDGTGGECAGGTALDDISSVTVSPDGNSAYATSGNQDDAVAVFDRAADGTLTQKAGTAGCISDTGSGGACAGGTALDDASSVTVSPDGKSAYVASYGSGAVGVNDRGAVAVFDRAANGTLTQKPGTAGCISDTGSGGACVDGTALELAQSVTVSPDGQSAYVASYQGNAVALFDRGADGTLTQRPGTEACISETSDGGACVDGKALNTAASVTVSPDGRSAYVASYTSDAVAVFDRIAEQGPSSPTVSIADAASVAEGNSGTTSAQFEVSLSAASSQTVTVDYATADGTATQPGDYVQTGGTLTFTPGQTSKTVSVDVNGDTLDEANEQFTVDLSGEQGATPGDQSGSATITDDDTAAVSIADATPDPVPELDSGTNEADLVVSLSVASSQTVTVDYATADGSATEPGDYVQQSDTLTFAPGETSKTVTVEVSGDTTDESDEQFSVNLSDPQGATLGDASGSVTIRDDDTTAPPPVDNTPPSTSIVSGPSGIGDDRTPTFTFSSDEPGSSFECSIDGGPFAPCSSPFTAPPLVGGLHTLRVRARDAAGNQGEPASSSFQIILTLEELNVADPPTLGVDVNVAKVGGGEVLVGIPGASARAAAVRGSQKGVTFVPLTEARQIPVGSFLNTRRGTVRLTSARDAAGATQTGDFARGLFQVLQSKRRSARGLTDLVLNGGRFTARVCGRPGRAGRAQGSALRRRTIRRLRSNAQGRFRTRGRHSAATVRGTVWETLDRCDGTLTKVTRGSVTVRDLRRRRNVVVRAGKSYLARAPG